MGIASYIDHTLLKPDVAYQQIERICFEAKAYKFASVCVNPTHVALCSRLLKDTGVKVCAVVGFPLGMNTPQTKAFETKAAIHDGATEIDMVMNISALKDRNFALFASDISAVVQAAGDKAIVKVIIETCYLSNDEKVKACQMAGAAGVAFVKTSTGFGPNGANLDDIILIRKSLDANVGIKASGGIKDLATALLMIEHGATRIGTSSSIAIIKEEEALGL